MEGLDLTEFEAVVSCLVIALILGLALWIGDDDDD
jgi:hypothetical protein